jgi:hypothetical protein
MHITVSTVTAALLLLIAGGCATPPQAQLHPEIREAEIRQVVGRLAQLKPGMTKQQVWNVLGTLPLEDKVVWISAGSDWGEGCDGYLLKHGYYLQLLWDQTDYDNWKYRRACFVHGVQRKLETIRLPEVTLKHVSLDHVIVMLLEMAKKADPKHQGINIVWCPHRESSGCKVPLAGTPDLPIDPNAIDPSSIFVNLRRRLVNQSLRNVLDAVVSGANPRVHFTINADMVVFWPNSTATALHSFARRIAVVRASGTAKPSTFSYGDNL